MDFHLDLGVKKVEAEITRRFMSSWRRTLLLQMSRMAFRFACMSMRVAMLQEVDLQPGCPRRSRAMRYMRQPHRFILPRF